MRKAICIASLAAAMMFGAGSASAEITAEASTDFVSKYIWRGFNLSDGPNVQPALNVDLGMGATIGYWGSFNWDSDDTNTEHNLSIGYDWDFGFDNEYQFSVGYTYYRFPTFGNSRSHEFWFGVSFENVMLTPTLTAFVDVGSEKKGGGDGEYFLLSVSHDMEVDQGLTMTLGADLGYNNKLFIDERGLADLTPSVALTHQINDHFTAGIKLAYTAILDSKVERAMGADDEFWAGINFTIS